MSEREFLTRPTSVYWLTRDADAAGTLSTQVIVWDERPWLERSPDGSLSWRGVSWGTFPYKVIAEWGHAMPETVRECIVSGQA